MKHLSQMTREELWASPYNDLVALCQDPRIPTYVRCFGEVTFEEGARKRTREELLPELEALRVDLQQTAAEGRQER